MERCATCKYWGAWNILPLRGDLQQCDRAGSLNLPAGADFDVEATADDDSGLEAGLLTGPAFGCVHHEPKEEEN